MKTIGVIGVGAFGEFMLPHLAAHFQTIRVFDQKRDLSSLSMPSAVQRASLPEVCACDVLILCVPVQSLQEVAQNISPLLRKGQLVMDLCSVKVIPTNILQDLLPPSVEILSLHPLFGPQSGRNGIAGLNITLCDVRSTCAACVRDFLREKLCLNIFEKTPEEHDREMAYVQGITHLLAKLFVLMNVPTIQQKTRTYSLLNDMVEMVRYDSEELFLAIQRENPYIAAVKHSLFESARKLEARLSLSSPSVHQYELDL